MSKSSPSFEEDMRLIREKRNVSRETLHQQTKVALENIELFEAGDLDRHPHFNEVYLRALVRAYAEVLDISKEMALQALDRSRAGAYRGELGDVYLEREVPAETEERGADVDRETQRPAFEEDVGEKSREDLEQDRSPAEEPEDTAVGSEDEAAADEGSAGSGSGRLNDDSTSSPRRRSTARQAGEGGLREWLTMEETSRVAMGVAGFVLVVLAVWALATLVSSTSPPESSTETAEIVTDTVDAEAPEETSSPKPVAVIGDSLEFTVVAAHDKLEPVRIRVDDGPWNPYWIEQGDSMSFVAHSEFALRRYLPRARVRVESLEWPVQATTEYDTLIVSRQLVQERIDSLSAARLGTP